MMKASTSSQSLVVYVLSQAASELAQPKTSQASK